MKRWRSNGCDVCLVVFVILCGAAGGQEWPRFRGPDGTGIGKGDSIPVSFTAADYLWQVKLPAAGHSSPVLWGDRIFLTCSHDDQQQREIVCLDADSGATLWSTKIPFTPYRHNGLNSFAASTPAIDAEHIYIQWISGTTFVALALDHAGNTLWQREMGEFKAIHGAGASPIAFGGRMIVGNDNKATSFLAGLDGKTGETIWQIKRDSKMTSYITPAVYRPQDGEPEVVFVSEANGMTAVDPVSGETKWESDKLFTLKSVASPVVAGDVIFATAGSGGAGRQSAAIRPGDGPAGRGPTLAWQLERDLPYVPTPIAVGEYLYILSDIGVMTCVTAATGEQVWQEDLDGKFYASPVCVNGRIYLITRSGEMMVLKAGPEYQLLAQHTLPETSDATPAIANGRMYIRTLNHLICIGEAKTANERSGLTMIGVATMKVTMIGMVLSLAACGWGTVEARAEGTCFFVAVDGDDANSGREADTAFKTLARARDAVRDVIAAGLKTDVRVRVQPGVYRIDEPLCFGPEDAGNGQFQVTYAACPPESVVISGGWTIAGWQQGDDGTWTASVPEAKAGEWPFRHLFVNGRRAIRARTPNVDAAEPHWQLTAANLSSDLSRYTLTLADGLLGQWSHQNEIEVMVAGNWAINRLPVQSVDPDTGTVVLAPPHAVGHNAIRPSPGRWCCFEGAPEMLDQPGEWYWDRRQGLLHYRPLPGEDMTQAEVVAPRLERLLQVKGEADRPVRNVHFTGFRFQYTGLALPEGGYMGIQACHCTQGKEWTGTWGRVPAAVCWNYVEQSSLQDCELTHLGGCGVELVTACHDNLIQGNAIHDVSGNGIMLGGSRGEAEVPKRNRISNNHVHNCGVEYYGAVGIWTGFAQQAVISHNLVHDLPYSGISIGWQWNPEPTPCKENTIEYNHVYDVMNRLCDGGCIYTLGLQPGTVIRGNHLHDVHRSRWAQGAPNNGMFIDEGSKGFLFEQNVIYNTAAELVRFNQCAKDWHTWEDNHFGPEQEVKAAGEKIIANAGPESPYRERFAAE